MAAGFFLFSFGDMLAKLLTESMHPLQIAWSRQTGMLVGVLIMLSVKGVSVLRSANPSLQIARGTLAATSAAAFIYAVSYVPLADAVAITFVAPFFVTMLGALILKEQVGWRRWSAVAIGFVGTLIVIRPGMGVMHPAAFLLIFAAGAFSLRQVLSRVLAGADSVMTTVSYTAIVSAGLLTLPLPFIWTTPTMEQLLIILAIGAIAAMAETLVIMALDMAQAVVLAPVHYTLIIWGTFYGFFVFGQLPDGWTWFGTAIIVASGLYTLNRERLAAKRG